MNSPALSQARAARHFFDLGGAGFGRELLSFGMGLSCLPVLPLAWSYCLLVPGVPRFGFLMFALLSCGFMKYSIDELIRVDSVA